MIVDFDKIKEEHIDGFKGGEGKLDMRAYVDDKARIMYSTLR
ncbi:MAG: cupin domain-containing protein, partial [Prevotella histicola]|nr:cupin domain-containing protein [Prevotella histicola]